MESVVGCGEEVVVEGFFLVTGCCRLLELFPAFDKIPQIILRPIQAIQQFWIGLDLLVLKVLQ